MNKQTIEQIKKIRGVGNVVEEKDKLIVLFDHEHVVCETEEQYLFVIEQRKLSISTPFEKWGGIVCVSLEDDSALIFDICNNYISFTTYICVNNLNPSWVLFNS